MNERCYCCGSWAVTTLPDDELGCRDCGIAAPRKFFSAEGRNDEWLDRVARIYAGLSVACRRGPPDVRDPFVQSVMAEMRDMGRPWLEDAG